MKCTIVDDEPLARKLLESYVEKVKGLELVKSCVNAVEAFGIIQQKQVDLILLDIKMPDMTGLDLLRSLKHPPRVIITTAYREYAFEAFDLDVVDYLLKPILFERFLRGIGKIYQLKEPINQLEQGLSTRSYDEAYIYLKAGQEMVKVFLKDVLYIESLRDYVRVKTEDGQIISYQRISFLEQKLPEDKFIRVHRSFIVALNKVVAFTNDSVKIGSKYIPIGRLYKNEALKALNKNNVLH